jgi:hypothetical protein
MLPLGFEPTISAGERPQSHALDRAATGTGNSSNNVANCIFYLTKKSNKPEDGS